MSDTELARQAAYQLRMAEQESAAAQVYRREAQKAAMTGDPKMAQLGDAQAAACERRGDLWTQLAGEITAYLQERAAPDPRLI